MIELVYFDIGLDLFQFEETHASIAFKAPLGTAICSFS